MVTVTPGQFDLELARMALAEPSRALAKARYLLSDPGTAAAERAAAFWALGLAQRELGELEEARQALEDGIRTADAVDRVLSARIRSSLTLVLGAMGFTEEALGTAELASLHLDGLDAARNDLQRGVIHQRLGEASLALARYGQALPVLRAALDRTAEANLLLNRALIHAYDGDLPRARRDLRRTIELAEETADMLLRAKALHNLAFVEGRAGDIQTSLALFSAAETAFLDLEMGQHRIAIVDVDRAEVLAQGGLLKEAIERAGQAVTVLEGSDDRANLAEAQLLQAQFLLLGGHFTRAIEVAERATGTFVKDERSGWAAKSRYVSFAASIARGDEIDLIRARRLTTDLRRHGWHAESHRAGIQVALLALAVGDRRMAKTELLEVARIGGNAPALARVQRHHAIALLRSADGDRPGARRAITSGLRLLEEYRQTFGSAELRAHAATHGAELVELATRMALQDGRAADVLVALDQVRTAELPIRQRPPRDRHLARDLAELRRLDGDLRDAARSGAPTGPVERQRAGVELRIRDRARTTRAGTSAVWRLDVAELRRRLAGRPLLSFFVLDDRLHVVEVGPRRTRHRDLANVEDVTRELDALLFALRRLAANLGSPRSLAATRASLDVSRTALQSLLGLEQLEADHVVIVPTARLRGVPWSVLPALSGVAVSVSPSAQQWLVVSRRRRRRTGRVLLASGPDLSEGDTEIDDIARLYPEHLRLRDQDASVGAVLEGLEGSRIGHLAAHGEFRGDNALFSAIRLADGPLTAYDLDALRRPPHTLVLSSCDAAVEQAVAGDAVLGLASGLLRLGVTSLIAPVAPIPDEATRPLMVDLHRRLSVGTPPSRALADAVAAHAGDSPQELAVRSSFICLGD